MKFYQLAIHDKISDNLFGFVACTDIESGAKFIIDSFASITEKLPLGDYEIVHIAYLDVQKKEFVNDYSVVAQLGAIEKHEECENNDI